MPQSSDPEPQLGIYRLTRRIGAGGMGEVWKAEDTRLHRTVAIKLLPEATTGSEESRARLLREARTAAQLYHPNIATIHHIELEGPRPYIVMEFVDGEPLTRAISEERLSDAEIAMVAGSIADALYEAHSKGIVHRDIKPDNVILMPDGRVKVLDFGIAKRIGFENQLQTGEFLTQAGKIIGTVNYMSPEQVLGSAIDGRSDIFSLGVLLYQALSGELPFAGQSITDTIAKIIRDDPPPLSSVAPDVVPQLAGVVAKCLQKSPNLRYATAKELGDALKSAALAAPTSPHLRRRHHVPVDSDAPTVATGPSISTEATTASMERIHRPAARLPLLAAAAGVAVLALLGWFISRRPDPAVTSPEVKVATSQPAVPPAPDPTVVTPATPAVVPQAPAPRKASPVAVAPPAKQASVAPEKPVVTEEASAPGNASLKAAFRQGLDHLESSGFHYVERSGAPTAGALAARRSFVEALRFDPKYPKARVRLAIMGVFNERYALSYNELAKLSSNLELDLDFKERAMASYAASAAALLLNRETTPQSAIEAWRDGFEKTIPFYQSDPEFAAFAEDLTRLMSR